MKPGLAILPLEVWADVLVFPWITREQLAQIVDQFGERQFAEKLQFRLHDMGRHSLRHLQILRKPIDKPKKNPFKSLFRKPKCQASLSVANGIQFLGMSIADGFFLTGSGLLLSGGIFCEFPQSEMPEKINGFNELMIGYLDDQVLDFMNKIKPILNNVIIHIGYIKSIENLRTLFDHLLPMIASIRQIYCVILQDVELLERHIPGLLARAKELHFGGIINKPAPISIPTYLDWLNTPMDFDLNGPRFLKITNKQETIAAVIDAVRKNFLEATVPSTFVILLEHWKQHNHTDEFHLENAATKEELTVQNGTSAKPNGDQVHYVEIMRHPVGAEAKMRKWVQQRAYYEKTYTNSNGDDEKQMISINGWQPLTIGKITKKPGAMDQDEEDKSDGSAAGPSTSSAPAKKTKNT